MVFVIDPICRIGNDKFDDAIQFDFVSDAAFIIIALPDWNPRRLAEDIVLFGVGRFVSGS
jgi:hypothetical protein